MINFTFSCFIVLSFPLCVCNIRCMLTVSPIIEDSVCTIAGGQTKIVVKLLLPKAWFCNYSFTYLYLFIYSFVVEFATRCAKMLSKSICKHYAQVLGWKPRKTAWDGWGCEVVRINRYEQGRWHDTWRSGTWLLLFHNWSWPIIIQSLLVPHGMFCKISSVWVPC